MSVQLEEFDTPDRPDFQRANGAPMVINKEGDRVRLSRPSNYAKPLDDESALTNWRIDTACIGVANDRAIQARYIATKRDDRESLKQLREAALQAGRANEGSDIETALHAMTERWEQRDPTFKPPEPYLGKLTAYTDALDRLGLVSQMFEFQTVNLDYGSAGTADRIYVLTKDLVAPNGDVVEAGELIIGDIKTNKRLDYSLASYSVQMALYAQGEFYDVVTDSFRPTPTINQRWGMIAWIPSQDPEPTCQMLWVDLEAGNYGAWLAKEVKDWRRRWRSGELASPEVQPPFDAQQVLMDEFPGGEIVDEMEALIEWCKFRIGLIKDAGEARNTLVRLWPEGLPTPKQGYDSMEQVSTLVCLLDKVEAEHSLTFPEGDPRVQLGVHRSALRQYQGGTS